VEIDDYASRVLAKHWPDVPRHDDVRTFPTAARDWAVDVICGGFPCQDISIAGKGAGLAGERSGLWYEFARIIRQVGPRWVIVENVRALTSRGLGTVLQDLACLGFDAEWHCIPACAVGAPHRRERIWIVAFRNTDSERKTCDGVSDSQHGRAVSTKARREPSRICCERDVPDSIRFSDALRGDGAAGSSEVAGRRLHVGGSQRNRGAGCAEQAGEGACDVADAESIGRWAGLCQDNAQQDGHQPSNGGWWSAEPDVGRVAHGVPARVDRLRGLGNAVVPQVVETIGRAIIEAEAKMSAD
jgi:DNA (cytosine-5)-methyltransferase 1